MNNLEPIFNELFVFVDEYIKDFGEPINPSQEEIEKLKLDIINRFSFDNPYLPTPFFLIERVAGEILFSHNLDKYLGLEGDFDLMTFHSYIQSGENNWHYLKEYLTWGKAGYMFYKHIAKYNEPYNFSFKTKIPMLFKDGKVYWVIQETHPLEIDADFNVISHINTYNVSCLYTENEFVEIKAEFYHKGSFSEELNLLFKESRYAIKPFSISAIQREILIFFHNNHNATVNDCSSELKYPMNTIKKYISDCQRNKGIINHAKSSFPHITFKSIKDVVRFLEKIGWFYKVNNGY